MSDISELTFWIPTVISIVAVTLFYLDMQRRVKEGEKASETMLNLIKVMREDQRHSTAGLLSGQQTNQEQSRQLLLQKQRELQWRQSVDTLKGIVYLAKIAKTLEEDE